MKRDLDLIRNLMVHLENNLEYGQHINNVSLCEVFQSEQNSLEKICYHLDLIKDASWINTAGNISLHGHKLYEIMTITNNGHDFLDAVRDTKIWDKVKNKLSEIGGYTLPIVIELGKDYLKKQIGL